MPIVAGRAAAEATFTEIWPVPQGPEQCLLCLSAVENVFELRERASVIVCPGIPGSEARRWKLKAGDVIYLRCPDGTEHLTNVRGLEIVTPSRSDCICLLLGPGMTKEMVPIGTTLWVDESKRV